MFGLLARGVSAFVASVSGNQKDDSGIEGSSNGDSRSVKSTNSSIRRTSGTSGGKEMTTNRQQFNVEVVKEANLDEIVQFLIDNFATTEAILASLKVDDEKSKTELTVMLRDLVLDSLQCTSSCVVRDVTTRQIDGVALACKTSIFDKQIDRLCAYEFQSQSIRDAVEFLKFVFNKLDVTYYLNEHGVQKPIFVAVTCVRKDLWHQGIGTALMNHVKTAAIAGGSDGLISLCSNKTGHQLMNKFCQTFFSVRYDSFKGEHKHPPIVVSPHEPFHSIYAMIARFT
uniref:N-acetyltransferase domain-containing protein n=1 Tax=Caenorhabditis japonica TaxID=281687 RepID=A0A8R1HSD9_CAEJA